MAGVDETMSGSGSGVAGVKPPATLTDLFGPLATHRYLVDPVGSKMELVFNLITHVVAITIGGQTVEVPFVKQ